MLDESQKTKLQVPAFKGGHHDGRRTGNNCDRPLNMGMERTIDTPMTHLKCWWPLAKLEGGRHRSSRANHFTGSNTDREAGSVEGKSLAGVTISPH